jgi:Raf kinase inhibitor-like YbhB/YbcL family protein
MQIGSPAFANQATIPQEYTCHGAGNVPPLAITGVPDGAKSLVLIVDDPDAVSGLFTHWLTWDLPPNVTEFNAQTDITGAVEGKNSTGSNGYIAPCPPSGTGVHHYRFQLFALKELLDLPENMTRDQIESAMKDLVIARAELVGQYGK